MHDWQMICSTHGPVVWRTVYRMLNDHAAALDCYQDVFLEAFQRNRSRPVRDWPSLLRWLSVKRGIDHIRQRKRRASAVMVSSDAVETTASAESPLDDAALNEMIERVCDELAELPSRQAQAFWLSCIEGSSYAEIAARLDASTNEVGVLIHRCRQRLRKTLADLNPT